MIRINLLPFRAARKKENIRRQISIFLLGFAFVVVVGIYWNTHLGARIDTLKEQVADTKKEVAKYKKINKKIQQIKAKLKILQQKTRVIRQLEKNRFAPVKMLDTMSMKTIAKRMWFTGFEDKGQKVQIRGIALDNKTIADFMTRLEGTGLFGSVKLNQIQKHIIKGSGLKKFHITCTKKGPKKPKKKPAKKKK